MNEASPFTDAWQDPEAKSARIPGGLNVLTILTLIACGLSLILSVTGFIYAESNYQKSEELITSPQYDAMPGFVKIFSNRDTLEYQKGMMDNKTPLLIINLVGLALCIVGALQMRKLMSQGFYLWLMGEVIPIIASVIFIGEASFKGFNKYGLIFPALFILLYALQLKHMKK